MFSRDRIPRTRRWVVKIGSALLTRDGQGFDRSVLSPWADQVAGFLKAGGDLPCGLLVNAAGPWVDQVLATTAKASPRLIGGTKGSHIVVGPFTVSSIKPMILIRACLESLCPTS